MKHAYSARKFIVNIERTNWHDKALWFVRAKRDIATKEVEEWEELRALASQIKTHVISNLDILLIQFEANATKNGIKVHWATDAHEHNKIVLNILNSSGVKMMVKSKSMLTEECHLNPFLEKNGIEVIDTDLGERIIQMRNEPPSHIVLPAIHLTKEEAGETFHKHLGIEKGISDPKFLVDVARDHLREKFLSADAALTGVNFGIADTGGFVVCTNEGNADMGVHLNKVHIASMGIEKIIPRAEDLGVFTRLLARSATGQPITAFTSHFISPQVGQEIHLIIVDNGRSKQLGRANYRKSLHCIRCGACMNTCPVYRRSGGYSYSYGIPGPIGSILAPGVDPRKHASMPFASTLCGSCTDVCPVKIDIHQQLYKWRQELTETRNSSILKLLIMKSMGIVLAHPALFQFSGKMARLALRYLPRFIVYSKINAWGKQRELPAVPEQSFREWYEKNRKKKV
jgi:L-lactate dehydrogenase complex protein LldF